MLSNSTDAYDCPVADEYGSAFDYVRVVLYCIIITVSLFGNMAVIVVVHQNKSMQTFTNILICNSAVADILITLVPNVYEVIDILEYKDRWALGGFMCSFLYMCIYLSVAATIITLMLVTIDRFLAVMLPYKKYFKKEMIPYVVTGIWVLAFLFSSPTTFAQKVKHSPGFGDYCSEDWPEPPFSKTESPKHYTVILFVFLYAIPLVLMACMYAIMAQKLRGRSGRHAAIKRHIIPKMKFIQMKNNYNSRGSGNRTSAETQAENAINNNDHAGLDERSSTRAIQKSVMNSGKKHKKRVIRMLMTVVLGFALCWLPVYIIQFVTFFHPRFMNCPQMISPWAIFFAFFMQYANSALNPVIYFTFSRTYRKGFITVFAKLSTFLSFLINDWRY